MHIVTALMNSEKASIASIVKMIAGTNFAILKPPN